MKSSLSDAGVLFEILSSSSLASLKIEARLHLSAQIWAPYRATGLTSASNRVVTPFTLGHDYARSAGVASLNYSKLEESVTIQITYHED